MELHIALSERNNLIRDSCKKCTSWIELTKSLSSVRLLGMARFRSRVKRYVNVLEVFFLPEVQICSYSFSGKAMS